MTRVPTQVRYSNYQMVGGVLVPFSVVEEIGGETAFSVRLNSITFNSGLQDADFVL